MSQFVRICLASEVPVEGEVAEFTVQGRALCVAHVKGTVAVLDGVCPHEGGPLGEGIVEDGRVVCPWHAYAFDPRTGVSDRDPEVTAEVFEAKIEEGELRARL
jgi:nitrite reductase/ring-hydroxylating ferredoxin subunit